MKRTIGRVLEVFIPEEYNNGSLLDIMDRTKIGFKVKTADGIKEIIQEQDELNTEIMKDDLVMITEQTISGKYFIDVDLLGDENE